MILNHTDLSQIRTRHKNTIIYARGAFDILHAGHIAFIEFAKQHGDILVLGIISNKVVSQSKGKDRPVKNEQDRVRVANAIKGIDYTFIVPPPTDTISSTELVIEQLHPDKFVLFNEKEAHTKHFQKLLKQHGIQLILDDSPKLSSTTALIERMRSNSQTKNVD